MLDKTTIDLSTYRIEKARNLLSQAEFQKKSVGLFLSAGKKKDFYTSKQALNHDH